MKSSKFFLVITLTYFVCIFHFPTFSQKIRWICTTDSFRWENLNSPLWEKISDTTSALKITIDLSAKLHSIKGWGGCFNELGWKALQSLDKTQVEEVVKSLFDKREGSAFNICRTAMGASDFALNYYSYDDSADDYSLKYFSIERDKKNLIPFIKAAMNYNPRLQIWASPWTPPFWMKTSNNYAGGFIKNDTLTLSTYARYQSLYVNAYQREGINLTSIHPQNEPTEKTKYPSCQWLDPTIFLDYIKNYLGPQFQKDKTKAEIWLGTITNRDSGWFKAILDDSIARTYIKGIGVQYASKELVPFLKQKYHLPMMQTETRCYGGKNTWANGEDLHNLICYYIKNGCQAYMLWNMVLDETGKSSWDWSQNASISIDTKNKKIKYNPQFFVMKHFSAFVKPGAYVLSNQPSIANAILFQNRDGSIVSVVANEANTEKSLEIVFGRKHFKAKLPKKSFNTFIFKP